MRALKRSERQAPKVSIILLDWSVRESFHLLHYLRDQEVSRDHFEVILIEYYSRVSTAAERYASDIDTWALLELPEECYYHKHLMYNAGLSLSRGDICVFCDSDAMVKPSFVGAIVEQFETDRAIVLHLDQFRNMRSDLYPFSYPSFDEVLGPGCINNVNGITRGLLDTVDPLHSRNYGACMCARREDLLAIGGADEHIDYLGHICGPYDMTFRLVNLGRSERWHESEFMYHTWHPGQAGVANYLGPHDGRHMSTTALEALASGRTEPLEINPAIVVLRSKGIADTVDDASLKTLIPTDRAQRWLATHLQDGSAVTAPRPVLYRGYRIEPRDERYVGRLMMSDLASATSLEPLVDVSEAAVRKRIDDMFDVRQQLMSAAAAVYVLGWRALAAGRVLALRAARKCAHLVRQFRPSRQRSDRAPVTGNPLASPAARATDRWNRFVIETRYFAGMLASLLASLYFVGRVGDAARLSSQPVVIVDRLALSVYLRMLAALRLLAPVDIIRVGSSADLTRWLSSASAIGRSGYVVVDRDLYLRHYVTLAPLRSSHRLVVA